MISQIKIQLNLYSHREKDNFIIERLGLSENSNNKVRDILYNLSSSQGAMPIESNNDLLKEIESLKNEIIKLQMENKILKEISFSGTSSEPNEVTLHDKSNTNVDSNSKINNKLLSSIKKMEI